MKETAAQRTAKAIQAKQPQGREGWLAAAYG